MFGFREGTLARHTERELPAQAESRKTVRVVELREVEIHILLAELGETGFAEAAVAKVAERSPFVEGSGRRAGNLVDPEVAAVPGNRCTSLGHEPGSVCD